MRRLLRLSAVLAGVALVGGCSGGSPSGGATSSTGTGSSTQASASAVSTPPAKVSLPPLQLKATVGVTTRPPQVTGYTYVSASESAIRSAALAGQQYTQISPGRVVRGVSKSGRRLGDLVAFTIDAKYGSNQMFRGQFLGSLATTLAGPGSKLTYGSVGETGIDVATGSKTAVVAWMQGNTVYAVIVPAKSVDRAKAFVGTFPRAH